MTATAVKAAMLSSPRRCWRRGFLPTARGSISAGGVVVQKGSLVTVKFPNQLVVFTERAPTGGSQGTVMDHFGFKVRNMAEVLETWRAAGMEVQSEFTGAEGFPNAYVVAPDGVRFELQEDPELPVKAEAYHVHFFAPDYL